MDTQVWMELAQQFKKTLSFYSSSSGECDISILRPHLRKAGKSYFEFLQNENPDITTTEEFLVEPVLRDVIDSDGREHRFTDAYDRYWICVLGLLGRCCYIIVKNKKLRGMKIPTSWTSRGTETNWSAYFLHGLGPREGFLLNEKDYVIDVCEASIQACKFLASELSEKPQPTGTEQETKSVKKTKKTKKVKKVEKKYKPWMDSGDACFIIEDNRIKFHYKNETKDLKLKSESNTHRLLLLIRGGSLRPAEIKAEICPNTTNKASKIVDYANKLLSEKIAKVGFVDVPPNIEFIKRDEYGHYSASQKIYEKAEFEDMQFQSN